MLAIFRACRWSYHGGSLSQNVYLGPSFYLIKSRKLSF